MKTKIIWPCCETKRVKGHRIFNRKKKNPAIERLIKNDTAIDSDLKLDIARDPSCAEIADKALTQLFAKAHGDRSDIFYSTLLYSALLTSQVKGDSDAALKDYGRVVFKHAENLAALIPTNRKSLLSVFPFPEGKLDKYAAAFRRTDHEEQFQNWLTS